MNENIITVYKDMPARVKSFVLTDGIGNYTIILNSKLSREQNLISLQHELEHIDKGDYDEMHDINILEFYRHNVQRDND